MSFLDVPGARLYYERHGSGPLLLLIGSPMDSTGFGPLASEMAGDYTVVTYDPRGIGNSTREATNENLVPEQQADDVHRLLAELGDGPADVFGSSGGGTVGLALVTAHPGQVRTLVAHEPPVIALLPDSAQVSGQMQGVYDTYRADGTGPAMGRFMAVAGFSGTPSNPDEPRWQPTPEQIARLRAANDMFLAHMILQTTAYDPDLGALRAASSRVVVGAGASSKGQMANRCAVVLAEQLGTPLVEFPGGHGGFAAQPADFRVVLDRVLTSAT